MVAAFLSHINCIKEQKTHRSMEARSSEAKCKKLEEIEGALVELQREHWRLQKRESRHTVHIESLPEKSLPEDAYPKSPETILIERFESQCIAMALKELPPVQFRRVAMRYLIGIPSSSIAKRERCSVRAVNESLTLAKGHLREALKHIYLFS